MSVYWLVQAVAYISLVLFLMPFKYIKKMFPYAFIGGFIYTWVVQYIAIHILRFWEYPANLFMVFEIPFFFVISWFAVTLLYGYILYKYPKDQLWIIALFVSWTTFNNYISISLNQISFVSWSIAETFMFAVFSHILLLYILKYMYKVEELGAKEYILSYSLGILKNNKQ